jgi:hypothetical protein
MAAELKLRMPQFRLTSKNRTFAQRFRNQALFWGIPVVCLEWIGLPIRRFGLAGLGLVLLIVVPATMGGAFIGALIETGFIRYTQRHPPDERPL